MVPPAFAGRGEAGPPEAEGEGLCSLQEAAGLETGLEGDTVLHRSWLDAPGISAAERSCCARPAHQLLHEEYTADSSSPSGGGPATGCPAAG